VGSDVFESSRGSALVIPYSLFPIPYDVEEIMTLLTGK